MLETALFWKVKSEDSAVPSFLLTSSTKWLLAMSSTAATSRVFICLVLVAATLPASLGIRWSECGPRKVPVKVLNVSMVPDPAVAGEDMTFVLPAESGESLKGGWVYVSVFFHGVPVHLERDNLCVKTLCPVPPGLFVFKNAQGLPDITPAGHYMLRLLATDLQRKVLFCAKVNFDIVKADSDVVEDADEFIHLTESDVPSDWETAEPSKEPVQWTHPAFQKK